MEIILFSLVSAVAVFVVMIKFMPFPVILYYQKWVDLIFTLLLPFLFWGTWIGMITAVFTGLFISIFLALATIFVTPKSPWRRKT